MKTAAKPTKAKLNKTKRRLALIVSALLILIGLVFLFFYFYWYFTGNKVIDINLPLEINFASENSGVVEELVSEAKIRDYQVPNSHPRYVSIQALGIQKTRILPVGLDKDGHIGTPVNIFDAAWYQQSGKPGNNNQVIFLDGHNGGPSKDGIFKQLPKLARNSVIEIERGDGQVFRYKVVENYSLPLNKFDSAKMHQVLTPIKQQETLAIVSCTGKWIQARHTYTDRVVVRAVRIN